MQQEGIKQQISFQIFVLYNTIFAYIPWYLSQRKQLFIKSDSSYSAACWDN